MPVATIDQEQGDFEVHLDRLAKDKIISILTMQMILGLTNFSFSELKSWLNSREKRIVRDAIPLIRTKDGKLGGLDLHKHFVGKQGVHNVYPFILLQDFGDFVTNNLTNKIIYLNYGK